MTLNELGLKHMTDKSSICHCYTYIYEHLLFHKEYETFRMLEIGVQYGLSLKMWSDRFPNAEIVGLDIIDNNLDLLDYQRVQFVRGSQSDQHDLDAACAGRKFDLIVDDGSHDPKDIAISFLYLKDWLTPKGIYIIEDLHVCKGGQPWDMIMSLIKNDMNCDEPRDCGDASKSASEWESVTFYRSLCILQKK